MADGMKRPGAPIPRGVVRLATVSVVPWTIGSLLSPFGEPHVAFIALPLLALGLVIAAVRLEAKARWTWPAWLFSGVLVATSITRFIVVPIAGEVFAGGEDLDAHGRGIEGVMVFLAVTKIVFYAAALGLVLHAGWTLVRGRPAPG